MAKNIVVCSDGTGNTGIKGRGTNVFKIFEAVDLIGHRWDPELTPQLAIYDDGVGSEDLKLLKILGGAAGFGLSRNVRQLYKELARRYDPGDRIYMFGFSRGAFTVRTLVGFIATCGIVPLDPTSDAGKFDDLVNEAYATYRRCYRTKLSQWLFGQANRNAGEEFRRTHGSREARIHFVGVWDTVDAVGLPFHLSDVINTTIRRFKFPDPFLSKKVDHAYHALSIDDDRASFHPLVWDEEGEDRIEQVWFAGVHSNVGGGYPKQGMSLVALDWMMAKAEAHKLRFNKIDRTAYRDRCSVDDKLYDPRAGLGTFYRWKPRDIEEICKASHMDPVRLHVSVFERLAHGTDDYCPENLPSRALVVSTAPDEGHQTLLLQRRAEAVEKEYARALAGGSLLKHLRSTVLLGRLSYYIFLTAVIASILAAAGLLATNPGLWGVITSMGSLVAGLVTSPLDTAVRLVRTLWQHQLLLWSLVSLFVLSSILSRIADDHIRKVSSGLWHSHQLRLRHALKDARAAQPL
jgi:uncharacterized protein (DUF2235 family)